MTQDLTEIIDATWPAAQIHHAGGFDIREGLGGGSRRNGPARSGRPVFMFPQRGITDGKTRLLRHSRSRQGRLC